MPISLPGPRSADSKYTTSLEGQGYDIRIRWNNRSESWFLYIGLKGQTPLLKTRIVTNQNLLATYRGIENLPPGNLYLLDYEKSYGRPSRDDFGLNKRFRLIYVRSFEEDILFEA
jgi:hypothetical protein